MRQSQLGAMSSSESTEPVRRNCRRERRQKRRLPDATTSLLLLLCTVPLVSTFSLNSGRALSLWKPKLRGNGGTYFCRRDSASNIQCWAFQRIGTPSSASAVAPISASSLSPLSPSSSFAAYRSAYQTRLFDSAGLDTTYLDSPQMEQGGTEATSGDSVNGGSMNGSSINGSSINGKHDTADTSDVAAKRQSLDGGIMDQIAPSNIPDIEDIPRPTENGGFSHTNASRAKISAANKGKVPWNKGKGRSEETKARIAAGVRARNRERFLKKLEDLGLTEEEYEIKKKEDRRRKDAERRARRTAKGGYRPTEETKQKISKILKEKHANGEIKRKPVDPSKIRRGFTHTAETKQKIAEALRNKWKTDTEYRELMQNKTVVSNTTPEIRKKISNTLKKKWEDPEFRAKMMEKMSARAPSGGTSAAHRQKISNAMKAKWQDKDYRQKTLDAISKHQEEQRRLGLMRPKVPRKKRSVAKKKRKKMKKMKKKKKKVITLVNAITPMEVAQRAAGATSVSPNGAAANKRKRVRKKKTARKAKPAAPTEIEVNGAGASPELVVAAKKSRPRKKAAAKKKKKKKEPDGSVDRLREERRDLFDLLYGDEDPSSNARMMTNLNPGGGDDDDDDDDDDIMVGSRPVTASSSSMFARFEDENLDDFDPYGLDDY